MVLQGLLTQQCSYHICSSLNCANHMKINTSHFNRRAVENDLDSQRTGLFKGIEVEGLSRRGLHLPFFQERPQLQQNMRTNGTGCTEQLKYEEPLTHLFKDEPCSSRGSAGGSLIDRVFGGTQMLGVAGLQLGRYLEPLTLQHL